MYGDEGLNIFVSEEGYVASRIMQLKCLTLCNPWPFGLDKKVRHWNCADNHKLIELSDLLCFGYDLSDTQDGLKCGIYILW